MPRHLFECISSILNGKALLGHGCNATGRSGIHPQIRIIAALRILAYGMSFDQADELCEAGATASRDTFLAFIK